MGHYLEFAWSISSLKLCTRKIIDPPEKFSRNPRSHFVLATMMIRMISGCADHFMIPPRQNRYLVNILLSYETIRRHNENWPDQTDSQKRLLSNGASSTSTHYNRLMRSWDIFSGAKQELSNGASSRSRHCNRLIRSWNSLSGAT
jgi:hypothetical protein